MNLPESIAPASVPCPDCGRTLGVIVVLDTDRQPLWYRCINCGAWDPGRAVQPSLFAELA